MAEQQPVTPREIERKYLRLHRQARRKAIRKKLPYTLGVLLLAAAAVAAVLWLNRPKSDSIPQDMLRVYILDVGQGDAVLIQSPDAAVLIDAGERDQGGRVVQMLKALHIRQIDCLINSHPHSDHLGGMTAVLEAFPVGTIYMTAVPDPLIPTTPTYLEFLETVQEKQIPLVMPECGTALSLGDAVLEFLTVDHSSYTDLNNCSLGCRLTCGKQSFLFCGDLEKAGEADFLAAGLIAPVTVLKCSHHGSNTSSCEEFLKAAAPQVAAISVGAENDYGHPAPKCMERLKEVCSEIYRTDLDGTVLFATDGETLLVQTNYDFGF